MSYATSASSTINKKRDGHSPERLLKYLDLDSTYRNRNQFPNPCDFVIPYGGNTGRSRNSNTSSDPVILAVPYVTSTLQAGSTSTSIVLNASSSPIPNFYIRDYLRIVFVPGNLGSTQQSRIVSYDESTQTAVVSPAFIGAPAAASVYDIRNEAPVEFAQFQAGSTTASVVLALTSNPMNEYYTGLYLRLLTAPNAGLIRKILSYNGTTKVATFQPTLPGAPVAGDYYEILQFSYDNFTPLNYIGTTTINQPVCYRIRLMEVSMPNLNIVSDYGGTIQSYPYFYVRLENKPPNNTDLFYSNNPNSSSAEFKFMVAATDYLEAANFIAIKGIEPVQTMKFVPNYTLHFTLLHSNGEVVVFDTLDYFSPLDPNPLVQIAATFELERVVTKC